MESKLVEYARAVVEDAVDVDADFFQKFRDAMSFRAIMQSQHPYIIGVAISDILKKRVFSRRSTFLFNSDDIVKSISVTGELCGYAFYAFSKVIALERDEFSDVVRDALLAASGSEAFNRDKASLNEEVAAAKRLLILLRVYEEYLAAVLFDYRDELIRRLVDEEGKIIVESSITQEDIDNIIYNMEIFCCHFIDKESRYAGDIEIGRDEKIYKKVYDSIPRSRMIEERLAKKGQRLILCLKNIIP